VAAFNATSLTRGGIWEALVSRNTYGCTDARMLLTFEIDGHRMGSRVRTASPPEIRAKAAGSAPVERLEVVRGDRLLHVHRGSGTVESVTLTDPSPEIGENYYYLRATQVDGEIGWSSPIWVSYEGPRREGVKLPTMRPPASSRA
jgi:hypothetical protein